MSPTRHSELLKIKSDSKSYLTSQKWNFTAFFAAPGALLPFFHRSFSFPATARGRAGTQKCEASACKRRTAHKCSTGIMILAPLPLDPPPSAPVNPCVSHSSAPPGARTAPEKERVKALSC